MKKSISIVVALTLLTATAFGNPQSDQCEQLKGSWEWNGNVNEWQCFDTNRSILDANITPLVETNATQAEESSWSKQSLSMKTLTIVLAPVYVVGVVLTTIIVAPVYLVKKMFGTN